MTNATSDNDSDDDRARARERDDDDDDDDDAREEKGRRNARARGANEEAGFWGRISWLLFFLGLFVSHEAFALGLLLRVHAAAGTRVRVAHARGEDDQREIKAFYSEYNPEKLRTVDELMIKYKKREQALYNAIKKNIDEGGAKRVDQRFDE